MAGHHIIITCGTSQIDKDKLTKLGITGDARDQFERDARMDGLPPEPFYARHQGLANQIVALLIENKDELTYRSAESIFGAEISTLEALKHHDEWKNWEPESDTYVILSSETGPGYFCAQILRRLITDPSFLGIPDDENIISKKPLIVNRLVDKPSGEEEAKAASNNLAKAIYDQLKPRTTQHNIRNIFIMTGGYKSVIPGLTLFSLFYGIELVYLFERSAYIQSLYPSISYDEKTWDAWKRVIQNLYDLIPAEDDKNFMRTILKGRIDHPERRY